MAVIARDQITLSWQLDIKQTIYYYKKQSSTAAIPDKPTAYPPTGWSTTEPAYSTGETSTLYVTVCTIFSDNTYEYSDVTVSSSFEAAKAAYNKAVAAEGVANNAMTAANGKNKIFYQDAAPVSGMSDGDLWFDTDGGNAIHEYKKTSSNPDTYAWVLRQFGTGSLAAGSVTANEINVNNLAAISAYLGNAVIGGQNNINGVLTVLDASGNTIGTWNKNGINTIAGSIGGWNISSNQLRSDVTINNTKHSAIMQKMDGTDLTRLAFFVGEYANGSSTMTSTPFSVNYAGKLHAEDAYIAGTISANSGTIGGWNVDTASLYKLTADENYRIRLQSPASPTTGNYVIRLDQKENNDWTNLFHLSYGGALYAKNANITGTITANGGSIGGFDISSTQLRSDVTVSGTKYSAVIQSMGSSTDPARLAFFIVNKVGSADATNPFYVRYDGYLKASSINGSFTVSPTSYVTITRSAGQSANPSMLTLNDLTDNYVADLRASQLALKPSSSSIYTATLSAIGGGQLILNSTANQLYGIRLIANSSYTSGEYVPQMILQGTTSATMGVNSSNPRIQFSNSNASQSLALVFTDHDTYQSPASLTLVGNQGGEYFIAPNIKIKDGGLTVAHSDSSETSVRIQNNNHVGSFAISSGGSLMLLSVTHAVALIQMDVDGITKVRCPNGMYRPVGSVDTDGQRVGVFATPSATTLRVYAQKGTAGASYGGYITFTGTSSSDVRLKKNIKPVEIEALPLINAIQLKSFDWIPGQRDYKHQPIGMIADQIEKLDSRLVIGGGYDPDGTPNYKIIDDHYLICYLTKAVQELSAKIKELERMKAA